MVDAKKLSATLLGVVREWVEPAIKAIGARFDEYDRRLAAVPSGPRGEKGESGTLGERGEPGERGPEGAPGLQGAAGERGTQGDRGERGEPGVAAYELAVERGYAGTELQWLESLRGPAGPDGKSVAGQPGERGEPGPVGESIRGEAGKDGLDGVDGKDADEDAIFNKLKPKLETFCNLSVANAVESIPKPVNGKDGSSIHADTVALMVREAVDKAVAEIPAAKDGAPGRDASELAVLPGIDEARSYPAGTYAKHAGGEIRAERRTDPVKDGDLLAAGWTIAREGVSAIVITQGDDPREISVAAMLTGGTKAISAFHVPMIIDLGVWREGEYQKGDHVSWDGSGWIAQRATTDKPGTSDAFRLSTKRGRDGKDSGPILRGPAPTVKLK